MAISITPISRLSPDHTPVTIKAVIRAIRPGPTPLIVREGVLKDESGEVAFTIWKDSGVEDLKAGQQYVFHRVDVGKREGRNEVRLHQGVRVAPIENDEDLGRVLGKIARGARGEREKLSKMAERAKVRGRRRNIYSILISAGVFLWIALMVLHFTGILTEDKVRQWIAERKDLALKKSTAFPREGTVGEVFDPGTISVKIGDETLRVRYLGLDYDDMPGVKPGKADPSASRLLNYHKYLVGGKNVRLEFEPTLPPENNKAVAYVFVGDTLANTELMARGAARLMSGAKGLKYYGELEKAEAAARKARLGVWSSAH